MVQKKLTFTFPTSSYLAAICKNQVILTLPCFHKTMLQKAEVSIQGAIS